eukprot:Skav212560  [mRNA]  locus=scaffold2398:27124:30585:+ [translate_table: standard]
MKNQAKTLPDIGCWIGVFTEEACCSRAVSPRGNPECWIGEYTYERCCPSEFLNSELTTATPAKQQTDSTCWNGVFTEEACCSRAISPHGNPECWIGEYTYERCCPSEFLNSELTTATPAKQQTDSTCWNGVFTEEACCSRAISPRGNPACWIGEYTYERCCPSEFLNSELTTATPAKQQTDSTCWKGVFTEEACCSRAVSPRGNPECWIGEYTYERCCPSEFLNSELTTATPAKQQTDSTCWNGVFTEEACCSRAISPHGNPECWIGEYTYERCCPSEFLNSELTTATPAKQQTDSTCWNGVFTEEACCSRAISPRGNPACWIGEYTYERCCPSEFLNSELTTATPAKQQTDSTCWNGVFTEEACCSRAVSLRGNPECWMGEYTYERCCPSKFLNWELTNKSRGAFNDIMTPAEPLTDWSCWTGVFSEEACCSSTVSPGGNPACWFGGYTYERCCPVDFVNKIHTEHVFRESPQVSQPKADCWKGNHNLEMGCCNPFEDKKLTAAFCWKDGRNHYDCCKRDYNVVASLATLLKQSVLKVVPLNATGLLELPLQRPAICQNTGGFTDLQVCQHLQQAEDMLRHGDPGCWSGFLTRDYCCDPPQGNPQCWNLDFTYETCCLGMNPEVAILREFYGCEKCLSMVQQPQFTCEDLDVWRRRGTIIAMSKGSKDLFGDVSVDVLCLPKMVDTRESVTAAIFALQWVKDHHRALAPSLHLLSRDETILEVAVMLVPWLAFRIWRAICGSDQPVAKVDQLQRIVANDGARLIGTLVVVLVHVNIVAPINDPDLEARRLMWHYALRFTDIFGVLSVLVTSKHSESLLGSADALWRKLGRQLPISFIMVRLRMWTAGLCQHFESCEDVANSRWSLELLVRCLTFSQLWHLSIDIKIWMVFRAIYWLNQHLAAPVVLLGVALICIVVVHQNTFHENLYYQFWAYRLPMSLLVYAFSLKRRQMQRWAPRYPWLWCSTAAMFCGLGWVGCIPQPANPMVPWQMQGRCTETGWAFFWGGVFFHLGVAMLCLFWPPRLSMPAFNWIAHRLSPLAFAVLTLHFQFFRVLNRCEHSVSPWFFFAAPDTEIQFRDDSPRWLHLVLWTGGIVLCLLAAQVVYCMVQQPWEKCWFQCPKPVSRVLVFAYLLLFLWKESSTGDLASRLAWLTS